MSEATENEKALKEKFGGLLHDYQLGCVARLDRFAELSSRAGARGAFAECAPAWPYRPAPHMPDIPHVCVKVPTGGGKTLIAAASVGPLAGRMRTVAGLGTEAPAVLWFAPTGAIVDQTLRALRDPENRCRQALDRWFPDRPVNPIPLREAHMLSPSDWRERANIVVSTIQSVRIDETEGRKIYESAGLIRHFRDLPEEVLADLREADGRVIHSLANVFRVLRPLVVVDEADAACSELSFRSLSRFSPSWILEITATPRTGTGGELTASNVLHQVSASALKRGNMIKFPLIVRARDDWRATVRAAVERRDELERAAGGEFRPVALFHAEPKNGRVTAEEVWKMLVRDLKIPEEQIARATGGKRELDGNAGTDKSPVRHVITVRQLARGWDCPAAYVLCSVSNLRAQGAVEQLLGRVLRMPGARRRDGKLGAAHVFAARTNFAQASRAIADMLEERHGFKRDEAKRSIAKEPLIPPRAADKFAEPAPLRIPRLMIRMKDGAELFEQSHFFLGEPWKAADLNPSLPHFSPEVAVTGGKVDLNAAGRVVRRPDAAETTRAALFASDREWTTPGLMAWFSRRIPHGDIPPAQMLPFIRGALEKVKAAHGMDDADLAANRFGLEREIARRLRGHRAARRSRGFQRSLTGMPGGMRLETSAEAALEISGRDYQPRELCEEVEFRKHLFPDKVGKFDSEEEKDCAIHIDSRLRETKVWLRNLSGDEAHSFWLPTSTDLFYPDFIVRLEGGRTLVVEYKGARDWDSKDTEEKAAIGHAWADLSGGKCLFALVNIDKDKGLEEINAAVSGGGF